MQKKALILVPLAFAALLAGIWLASARYAPRQAPAPAVTALWQLDFPDSQGRRQPLSQWRGRVLVLNFWASWCAPCREEIPDFAALREEYRSRGVEFVGIAVDTPPNVARFLAQVPVAYPILIGEGAASNLARQLGDPSGALPYTIVLDRAGNIVLSHLGRLPRATLAARLRQLGS
jgi:thiol-disulfide isomerase/thioredoxin